MQLSCLNASHQIDPDAPAMRRDHDRFQERAPLHDAPRSLAFQLNGTGGPAEDSCGNSKLPVLLLQPDRA
jgi:hypothetical protein